MLMAELPWCQKVQIDIPILPLLAGRVSVSAHLCAGYFWMVKKEQSVLFYFQADSLGLEVGVLFARKKGAMTFQPTLRVLWNKGVTQRSTSLLKDSGFYILQECLHELQ